MDTRRSKQKRLGQNFLKSARLAARLVELGSIGVDDIVCEIGSGRGILTAELARRARTVIGIERDHALAHRLRKRFAAQQNVRIVEGDFLEYRVACPTGGYKIFANVPFGITSRVMQKVLYEKPVASEIYLVLQREVAAKYAGTRGETLQSLLAKPRFSFEVIYRLRRTDFYPVPDVDSVLLR